MKAFLITINLIVIPFVLFSQKDGLGSVLEQAKVLYQNAEYVSALEKLKLVMEGSESLNRSTEINVYLLAGNIYSESGQFETAENFYNKALSKSKKYFGETDSLTIQAMNNLGQIDFQTGQIERSFNRTSWVLDQRIILHGKNHPDVADAFNNLGNCRYAFQDLQEALELHKKALFIRENKLSTQHPDLGVSYLNVGNCYSALGKLDSASIYFENCLNLRNQIYQPDHPKIASIYMSKGKCLVKMDRSEEAIEYFQKALKIYKKKLPPRHPKLLNYYETIGDLLMNQGIFHEAVIYYSESFTDEKDGKPVNKKRSKLANKIGLCSQHIGEFRQAILFHENAIYFFKTDFGAFSDGLAELISNLGNAYFRNGEIEKAATQYQFANKTYKSIYGGLEPTITNNLGLCALELGDTKKAISFFKKGLEYTYGGGITITQKAKFRKNLAYARRLIGDHKSALRTLEKVSPKIALEKESKNEWLNILIEKGIVLSKLGRFNEAEEAFIAADKIAKELRIYLIDPEARQQFQKSSVHLYRNLVAFYYEQWDRTKDIQFLEKAFTASEKSKSFILLESVNGSNVKKFAGVPNDIIAREKQLIDLVGNMDIGTVSENLSLSSPQLEFEKLLDEIRDKYPNYYELKYEVKSISTDEVKQFLTPEQTLLEYFVGDSTVFIFEISEVKTTMHAVKMDFDLNELLLKFRRSMDTYPKSSGTRLTNAISSYNKISNQIYDKIFAPLTHERSLAYELIIVPDGILHYLPFECLLTLPMGDSDRFKTHPYLIFNHQINYAYSASMLQALSEIKLPSTKKTLLSVAPTFDKNQYGLSKLRHNISEAERVAELYGGDLMVGNDATLPNFLEVAEDYRILLFATHGEANARSGEFSWLAFTELNDSIDNELLYARYLYEKPLAASLVVLSACETGIGEYQQGEGVLSLARGFFYAGAQSIIPTLWSVDDARNSEIIKSFFEYLHSGNTVSRSLHLSKLEFLKYHSHDEAHPVYWAAPVVIGLADVDVNPSTYQVQFYIGFGVFIMAGFGLFSLLKKKNNGISS